MHLLDGSAGGGQLVRTALTLSAVTDEPFRMRHVRRARSNPGLQAQHCASVEAVAAACNAETENVEVGAEEFSFEPNAIEDEEDHKQQVSVTVGTAGSVPLVFDALLPLGVVLDEPFTAHLEGGTDAKWAPPFDYFQHVKHPLLESYGVDTTVSLKRRGFYPRGGGKASLTVNPFSVSPLELTERGERTSLTVRSVAEESLEEDVVAERQADAVTDAIDEDAEQSVSYVEADCPGSAVVLDAEYEHSRAGFAALGERGKPANDVGEEAAEAFEAFEAGDAAVDEHLADQLVPYLALAGGEVRVPHVTNHIETCVGLVEEFGYDVEIEDDGDTVILSG